MKTNHTSRRMAGALLMTAFLATLFMLLAAYGPGSRAQAAAANRIGHMAPAHETETGEPEETETHHPEATGTHEVEPTETNEPEETHHPEATGTHRPEATRTHEVEPTETNEPKGTRTPEPNVTETHEVEPTETHHPEGTKTAEATGTHKPMPSPIPTGQSTTSGTKAAPATVPGTGSRAFPQTGNTVKGIFLQYWDTNGGLPQQGLPISGAMQEKSDMDGKIYAVQYFERAVFEYHPEVVGSNNVLLSQLGRFRYNAKYPTGASGQVVNKIDARYFPETKHSVGGVFLTYWQQNGGLAQQGFPISEEFTEISPLNGKPYTVQYFERAVFEYHPENKAPYNVLLSQLGTFRLKGK